MNFENKGKWLKEAQDKMAARDTMEDPDFLDGDNKVLTFEEEELDIEDNDIEEEPVQKNEKAYKVNGKTLKIGDKVYYNLYGTDYIGTIVNFKDYNDNPVVVAHKNNTKDLQLLHPSEIVKVESAQKNEAKLDKGYDISFDNIGGGFEVVQTAITNGYGIELSGYSNNTSKKLTYVHPTLSNDSGLTQDVRREHYDALNAKRTAIAKDLKPLADKFDKDIEAVFAKHGFKKA